MGVVLLLLVWLTSTVMFIAKRNIRSIHCYPSLSSFGIHWRDTSNNRLDAPDISVIYTLIVRQVHPCRPVGINITAVEDRMTHHSTNEYNKTDYDSLALKVRNPIHITPTIPTYTSTKTSNIYTIIFINLESNNQCNIVTNNLLLQMPIEWQSSNYNDQERDTNHYIFNHRNKTEWYILALHVRVNTPIARSLPTNSKPISNLLLTIDTQTNNKSLKLTTMLSSSDLKNYNNNCNNNSPFGYLYNNRVLDTSYNCVFDTYYQYIDSIQSISKIAPKLKSEQTPNDNNIAQIDLTHSTISEPILKHCISIYAVLPPSIPTIPSINNINEEFCLLEQMAEQINNGIDSGNLMILSLETMNYLKEQAGERENKSITAQNIFNKLTDGIALVIPGIPLLNGFIKLTNYRLLFNHFKNNVCNIKHIKIIFKFHWGLFIILY